MRPPPFTDLPWPPDERFRIDATGGQVWHRVFHRPLYADTDRSQVVYHANYLRYFELGRATLMRDMGYPYREVEASGYVYPITDLGLRFVKPLFYDDPMWVHTRPADQTLVTVRFDYLITHGETGEVICLGHTRHCALFNGRPSRLDPATRTLWASFPRADSPPERAP